MSSRESAHCRLCAGMKSISKLINLETDVEKRDEIVEKLSRLNVNSKNLFDGHDQPKTVCLICLETLDRAYKFVRNVENAQEILGTNNVYCKKVIKEVTLSDDGKTVLKVTIKAVKEEPAENTVVKVPKKPVTPPQSQTKPQGTWKEFNWACGNCETLFLSLDEFKSHSMSSHACCNNFKCMDCDKRILRLDKFILHMNRHRKHLKLSCYMCYSTFPSAYITRMHKKTHLMSENICSGCNSTFPTVEDLTQHVKSYYKNNTGNSLIAVSNTSDDLTCAVCKKPFKSKSALNGHLLVHVIRQPNNKERSHVCDRCGKGFYNKSDLKAHVVTHNKARPFKCKICTSDFKTAYQLNSHIKRHDDLKPFSCKECGRRFKIKPQLKRHEIIHRDTMPFSCTYCDKAFRFQSVRDVHLRQHTGVKPYECKMCERRFTNWSNYNKHMKRVHGISMVQKKLLLAASNKSAAEDTSPEDGFT